MQRTTLARAIRALIAQHKRWDLIVRRARLLALMVGVLTFVALFVDMAIEGLPRLIVRFLHLLSVAARRAAPASSRPGSASTLVMLVTAVVAVPLGVAAGVYLEEYAPKNWVTDIIEINITNLAGVPSIVYGLLALGLFVYQFGFGQSILSAGLTLALLILPVVIVATREAIRAIPQSIREGAYALRRDHMADRARPHPAVFLGRHPDRRDHRHGARHRRDRADHHHRRAHLHRLPAAGARSRGEPPFRHFDWLFAPFTVMPIQMFNWTSRPEAAFQLNAAAAGLRAGAHDADHERPGDLAALSSAQEHQVVNHAVQSSSR